VTQGVIIEIEHEGRKLTLNAMSKLVQNSLILIIRHYIDPYECWQHLTTRYEANMGSWKLMLLRKLCKFLERINYNYVN
jgi:hypothetical protein